MKLKIIIDGRMIFNSGIGRYIQEVTSRICSTHSVSIFVNRHEVEKIQELNFKDKVTWISLKYKPFNPLEIIELYMKSINTDIYWSPHFSSPILHKSKSLVSNIHDIFPITPLSTNSYLTKLYAYLRLKLCLKLSDKVITISKFSKNEITKSLKSHNGKIEITYLGVNENYNVFNEQKIIGKEDYILYVGNLKPHKNLENLIKAIDFIRPKSLKLKIIGKLGGFKTGTNTKLLNHPRIEILGEISEEDLKNHYKNAKAFIFPTKYEGFGLPILEAMKFNLPIAASSLEVFKELFADSLHYFNPNDPQNIGETISEMLKSNKKFNTQYKGLLETYTWDKTANQTINIFLNSLLN